VSRESSSTRPTAVSKNKRRSGTPVWERGRAGRLWGGVRDYAKTAWWGLVSPHVSETRPLIIAQAVILREAPTRQVLLSIRSDLFGWELPGGTLEEGESAAQAVVREVREETGLDVEPFRHVGDWVRRGFRPHTARIYACHVRGGVETPSHETPRVGWFDVDALPEGLFPWYHEPLRSALVPADSPIEGEDVHGVTTIWTAIKIDLGMRWRGLPKSGAGSP
jgi:ADP-ribose pyrophosphatase YjhB (NUDIX family)